MSLYSLYLCLLCVTLVANFILIVILYKRKQRSSAIVALIILLLLVNIWFGPKLLTNALHASGIEFEILSRIAALGYIFVPAAFLTFSLANGAYKIYLEKFYYWVLV